jgi:serine/threonine protein kinase/tetratricopeptide (TPR) repeat protein
MSEETIFAAALERGDPTVRAAYLDAACGENAALRRRLEALLQAHDAQDSLLDIPPAFGDATYAKETEPDRSPTLTSRVGGPAADSMESSADFVLTPIVASVVTHPDGPEAGQFSAPSIAEGPGTRIGPYKLLQMIGEGGMGTVFMAEQERPVRRRVALKIIKAGMDTGQVVARFEAERQALALMDHPNIAKVLDAGATATGRPYFVMELVKGIPITDYCDQVHLSPRERLELFVPVCQAIQHAHQKGIIHRDVKPSNVMVTLVDGKPTPKVIDFGVAKATDQKLTERSLFTQYGTVIGTLEYMSPEQAELSALDVDTRSDVFSLGVLLYELLTGTTPLERARLRQSGYAEILRRIREEEAPRPSTRLSGSGDALPSIAALRHTEPAKLTKIVRGELDWIVMKALEKDRSRRYETANGLAADVRHYLDDEPVQACPPTAAYRLSKFARKYRTAMAMACAFVVVLMAASIISVWQAVLANHARAEAVLAYAAENQQRREAQGQRDRALRAEVDAKANLARARAAVEDYLTTISESRLLNSPLPGLQPLRKELLVTALRYYEDFVQRHQDDTDLRADLAAATLRVGEITDQIGAKGEAVKAFQTASRIYESLAGADSPTSNLSYRAGQGHCLVRMAMIQFEQGQSDESLRSFERSLAFLDQLERDRPGDPATRVDSAVAHHYLSLALLNRGNAVEAIRHQRAAIELRKALADELPTRLSYQIDLALSFNNLGFIQMRGGQLNEAFDSVRRANEIQRTLVVEHPEDPKLRHTLALSTQGMASILNTQGRWKESRPLSLESVEIMSQIVSENPAVTEFRRALATTAAEFGQSLIDHDEIDAGLVAFAKARDQSETVRRTNPKDVRNINTLASIHRGIGKIQAKQGKTAEALASFHEAIVLGERIAAEDNLFTYDLACGLALYGEFAGHGQSGPEQDAKNNSQNYSDKAMTVLQQAVNRGWRQADWIERDPELRSLRSRADFQALLKTIRQ